MKRIFIILTCAACLMACGNKAQNAECKSDCCDNKKECKKEVCEKKCGKQECEKKCDQQQCADKKCGKQECNKECSKQKCNKPAAGCITLNGEEFAKRVADLSQPEWKYLGDKPAVVDFYADWCGPCRAIAPYLEDIAKMYDGKLYVYKINVDNDPEIANAFNVRGIPTLLFIPTEGKYTVKVGSMSKEELEQMVVENCFK